MDPRFPHMGPDWGPPPPGWESRHPNWDPRGPWPPPDDWGPPPGGWGPRGPPPPDFWGPRGPPPDWDCRGPPGWGPHPDDWPPPHWGPDNWRREEERRRWLEENRARGGWGPPGPPGPPGPHWDRPPGPWGPEPPAMGPPPGMPPLDLPPPGIPPIGPLPPGLPPPGVPPNPGLPPPGAPGVPPQGVGLPPSGIPPPDCPPPFGFQSFPPGGWSEASSETDTEKPIWIKALLSAPTANETKSSEEASDASAPPPPPPGTEAVTKKPKKVARYIGLLGKCVFKEPPPGRSIGTIAFIGPSFGHIERDDKEKFHFDFSSFFGNPKARLEGVRVHFTALQQDKQNIATDIKVPEGGTWLVDPEIYEGVVSQSIQEPAPGERLYPGQVNVTIGKLLTNVIFEKKDSTVTLLDNDHILLNLVTDIVTNKRRATNIRPKIPETFKHTNETRDKGVILSFNDNNEGVIKCDAHGELPFAVKENFSDVEFTEDDVNEEVEFTVIELRTGKHAIRICRVKEPLLFTLSSMGTEEFEKEEEEEEEKDKGAPAEAEDLKDKPLQLRTEIPLANFTLDKELYEGVVSQPIIEPTEFTQGYPGQIHAMIGTSKTNVTFDHRDCGVTLLKCDQVLMNLLIDKTRGKKRAANIKPKIPFTFTHTNEMREMGVIVQLGAVQGTLASAEHGHIPFDKKENFSDTEFSSGDINKEVEFTLTMVKSKKCAIRLRRMNRVSQQFLLELRKRQEQEELRQQKIEERKQELERLKREEEERRLEAERKKKEEVAAALAAAREKLTPLGFMMRGPDPDEAISKDRFNGTVLKAVSKHPPKEMKKEPEDPESDPAQNGTINPPEVKIKVEKEDSIEAPIEQPQVEVKTEMDIKENTEEEKQKEKKDEMVKLKPDTGLLVMTVDGQQKKLSFERKDLLTRATMLVGDKVRFSIATRKESKEERAAYVEILADSFEESAEERHNGIVIDFFGESGLIKCSQNPQLYFDLAEVIEKKKLELNEKVEFSIIPHDRLEGEQQAVRIKRYTESMFLPVKKLSGVTANKPKPMTIKLSMPSEEERKKAEAEKLKAVVKNLRSQDNKSRSGSSRHRSKSKSPEKDKFGRVRTKRSTSKDRHSRDRSKKRSRSRSRDRARKRSRSKERSRRRSKSSSSSRSRSRSRDRCKEKSRDKTRASKRSREREESSRRRRETSPRPPHHVDDELARKKRELEELNEMIAYKKALVEPRGMEPRGMEPRGMEPRGMEPRGMEPRGMEPRGMELGGRTCIDYDHGRRAVPLKEVLPEYPPPKPYGDPYYDRDYSIYRERRYADPYTDRYADPYYERRPFGPPPYDDRPYPEPPYGEPSRRYPDRYDVYDPPLERDYRDPKYPPGPGQTYPDDLYGRAPRDPLKPLPQHSHAASTPPFRPPSPEEPPPKSPPPKQQSPSPPVEKPPLDRFLDMLHKKKITPEKYMSPPKDELLPHERALKEGTTGFSQIVGLATVKSTQPTRSISPPKPIKPPSPKPEPEKAEPYDKIQSLLRTIGLKFSSDDMTKLRSQAGIVSSAPKSASLERDVQQASSSRTSSVDRFHSPSPARSASVELAKNPVNEYESFLDQQELEALQKAQQMQSLTRSMSESTSSPRPPPGPPPAQYQRPPVPHSWDVQIPVSNPSYQLPYLDSASTNPPGPLPGPPLKRGASQAPPGLGPPPKQPTGQAPLFSALSYFGQATAQSSSSAAQAPSQSSTDPAISTTVARCLQVIETVRTLAQPSARPSKSVQFNLPSESSSQAMIESEEDIKNMQKERLDLYNQRLLEKRVLDKKKFLEARKMDKNKDGTAVVPAKPLIVEQRNVWICGHSLIYWAESRAKSPEVGMQLGMDPSRVTLWWRGTQGMTWSQLLPQLHQLKVLWPNPDVLIIHLGGNDLNDSPTDLLTAVRRDLASIRSIFPRCLLVWSHILPRRVWRHSDDSQEVDLVRTTVNRRIHSVLTELGGVSLAHDNIRCGANTGLYRADGVHLSPKGIDVFNLNLQDLLEKWDQEVNKIQ